MNKRERACKNCSYWAGDKFQTKINNKLKYIGICINKDFNENCIVCGSEKRAQVTSEFACKYHEFI